MELPINEYLDKFPPKVEKGVSSNLKNDLIAAQQKELTQQYQQISESFNYVFNHDSISSPSETITYTTTEDIKLTQVTMVISGTAAGARDFEMNLCLDNTFNPIVKTFFSVDVGVYLSQVMTIPLPDFYIKKGRDLIGYVTASGGSSVHGFILLFGTKFY